MISELDSLRSIDRASGTAAIGRFLHSSARLLDPKHTPLRAVVAVVALNQMDRPAAHEALVLAIRSTCLGQ